VRQALINFSEAQGKDPDNYQAYLYLGEALLQLKNFTSAETMFNHAADLFATYNSTEPGSSQYDAFKVSKPGKKNKLVMFSQARLCRETGRWDKALDLLDELSLGEEIDAKEKSDASLARIIGIRAAANEERERCNSAEAFRLLHNLLFEKVFFRYPLAEMFSAKR
jgi:tetratricopeptide (TPR) repeat protein